MIRSLSRPVGFISVFKVFSGILGGSHASSPRPVHPKKRRLCSAPAVKTRSSLPHLGGWLGSILPGAGREKPGKRRASALRTLKDDGKDKGWRPWLWTSAPSGANPTPSQWSNREVISALVLSTSPSFPLERTTHAVTPLRKFRAQYRCCESNPYGVPAQRILRPRGLPRAWDWAHVGALFKLLSDQINDSQPVALHAETQVE